MLTSTCMKSGLIWLHVIYALSNVDFTLKERLVPRAPSNETNVLHLASWTRRSPKQPRSESQPHLLDICANYAKLKEAELTGHVLSASIRNTKSQRCVILEWNLPTSLGHVWHVEPATNNGSSEIREI